MPDSTALLWTVWLTAGTTIGAAVIVGWLGLRERRTRLTGAANVARLGHLADVADGEDTLVIDLSNLGTGRVVITEMYWRIGWLKPDIVPAPIARARLPLRIESQHGASLLIALGELRVAQLGAVRQRKRRLALVARTMTGSEVRCTLTRDARQRAYQSASLNDSSSLV
jgi:hypothetical protein